MAEHNLFTPKDDITLEYGQTLLTEDLRSIASIKYPAIDFSTDSLSTKEIQVAINAISSAAIAAEEEATGKFTQYKFKKLSTWGEWKAGEKKQLDQFHQLQMYGKPIKCPPNVTVLQTH